MPLLEMLLSTLGLPIGKAIVKTLVESDIAASAASGLLDLVSAKSKDQLARRRDERRLQDIGKNVVKGLVPLFERAGLQENDQRAVALAVADTIEQASINAKLLAELDLQSPRLAAVLLDIHRHDIDLLGETGTQLYRRVIEKVSSDFVDIASQLPNFTEHTFAELLERDTELLDRSDLTLQVLEDIRRILEEGQKAQPEKRVPLQRPERAQHFTDREEELTRLSEGLRPGLVETVVGPGGMGKSALAAEAIWGLHEAGELLERFPDGLIFHTFYNQPEADVAMERIAEAYGVEAPGAAAEGARHALTGRTALLVLDGAEDADDLPAVLSVRGGCGVLITTRDLEDAPGDWEGLDPLPGDEALKLLREWAGQFAAEEEPSRAICDLVGGLPLAIRLAGRYMKRRRYSAKRYLALLQKSPLKALTYGQRQLDSVPVLMARSLEQVGETARQVMSVAGVLALVPFERLALDTALNIEDDDLEQSLDELLDFGLLLPAGDERLQAGHSLVRTYAQNELDPPEGALDRLAAYYQNLVEEQNALGAAGHARLDLDRPHLMALLRRLSEREAWTPLLALADSMAGHYQSYLFLSGRWTERIEVCDLALAAALAAGERWLEGNWLNHLALAHADVGRLPEAIDYYEQALGIVQELEDRQGEGVTLSNLGIAYANLGRHDEAIDYYKQALAISREIRNRRDEGHALGNLGIVYAKLDQNEKAADYFDQALTIAREIGDRRDEGEDLGNLGNAYAGLDQYEKAADFFQQALTIAREIGNRSDEGRQLGNLGSAYHNLGRYDEAIDYYNQALIIDREIGRPQGEAIRLFNIGNLLKNQGKPGQAADHYRQALAIFEAIKSPYAENARQALESLNAQ